MPIRDEPEPGYFRDALRQQIEKEEREMAEGNGQATNGQGHNLAAIKDDVKEGVAEMVRLEGERKAINEQIGAIRQRIVSKGVNRHALKAAISYYKSEEGQRAGFDSSYRLVREAVGVPVDNELPFAPPEQPDDLPETAEAET